MGLFRRQSKPGIPSTGHAGDDEVLAQIAAASDLAAPRHWVHYLNCKDEGSARQAAAEIEAGDWQLQQAEAAGEGPGWVVIAERHGAVTSPAAVRAARLYFEALASRVDGDYDGWEVSA